MKQEQKKSLENIQEISTLYDELNENALKFNSKKTEYDSIMDTVFYTNFYTKNEEIVKILNEYDEILKDIITNGNNLKEKCAVYYSDADTTQKCNSYKISYESAVQVFLSDIERYNTLVENYNTWTEENGKYEKITKFSAKSMN
jgi:hypothetical protein